MDEFDAFDEDTVPEVAPADRRDMGGSAESAAFFNAALAELELSKRGFAKLMKRKGDDRQPGTILRSIQRMTSGEARVSGEMPVILTLMTRAKRRGMQRTAAKAEAALEDA